MTQPRVIFLNGAFGAGKTTAARELHAIDRRFAPYDPELIGIALQRLAPWRLRPADFQDLRIWRAWATRSIELRAKSRPTKSIVVPMTLITNASRQALIGTARTRWPTGVLEVWLQVSYQTLHKRLMARNGRAAEWALQQLGACNDFVESLPTEIVLVDGETPPPLLADAVRTAANQV